MPTTTTSVRRFALLAIPILFLSATAFGQTYTSELVNRGSLYAAASLVHDFDGDGDLDIVVTRLEKDGVEGGVEWLENDGSPVFQRHEITTGLLDPIHIQRADIDGDGDDDYAVADDGRSTVAGALLLLLRQDDDTFVRQDIQPGRNFDEVDVADFDGDGLLDLVAVGFGQDSLRMWMNAGDLTFTETVIDPDVNQIETVEAADVDGDGDVDILVDDRIYYNDGSGGFGDTQDLFTWSALTPSAGRDFAVADIDNDGVVDILTFATVGTGGLYLLDGASGFAETPIPTPGVDLGGDLLVADLDGNGWKDIIRQNSGDDYVSVLYQTADGVFDEVVIENNWDTRGRGAQMALGDLDGDGDDDVVFPEYGNVDGDLSWFENRAGTLYRHYLYSEVKAARFPRMADLDADGDLDIVLAAGNGSPSGAFTEKEIVWYENQGADGFLEWRIDDDITFPEELDVVDLDDDGTPEVVAIDRAGGALVSYTRAGVAWTKQVIAGDLLEPAGLAVADLNGDDRLDIAVVTQGDSAVAWFENTPAGYEKHLVDNTLPLAEAVAAYPGGLVVVAKDTSHSVVRYTLGEVMTRQVLLTGHGGSDVEVGDWSGDGVPDILAAFDQQGSISDPIRVAGLIADGSGGFGVTDLWPTTSQEKGLALKLADADGDGDLDLFVSQMNLNPALALLVNDDAATPSVVTLRNLNRDDFTGLDAGDIDGDGDIDLVAAGSDGQSNAIELFRLTAGGPTSAEDAPRQEAFALGPNYPNPFNGVTRIGFDIDTPAHVRLDVYDVLGRHVARLADGLLTGGHHEVAFSAPTLRSGIYVYRLDVDGRLLTRTMTLIR